MTLLPDLPYQSMKRLIFCSASLVLAGTALAQAPANDTCLTGTAIDVAGLYAFDAMTSNATTGTIDNVCAARIPNLRDVWFTWTCPADGQYEFETESQQAGFNGYDTIMTIYNSTACDGADCLYYSDDIDGSNFASRVVTNNVLAGTVYSIQIGTWSGSSPINDTNTMSVTFNGPVPPANDDCSTPEVLSGVGVFPFAPDATFATDTDPLIIPDCTGRPSNLRDVWFEWTSPADDIYIFETESQQTGFNGYDTVMRIYDNALCDGTGCIGWNDDVDGSNFASRITSTGILTAGSTYLIQVGTWSGTSGMTETNTMTITAATPPPPVPMNDDCANAEFIAGEGLALFDMTSATDSGIDASGCTGSNTSEFDVWYDWLCLETGLYSFQTLDSPMGGPPGFDTKMAAYDGVLCDGTECIAYNDDKISGNWGSELIIGVSVGDIIRIQIASFSSTTSVGPNQMEVTKLSVGTTFCDPSGMHSGGDSASLVGTFGSGVGTDLHLDAFGGPAGRIRFHAGQRWLPGSGLRSRWWHPLLGAGHHVPLRQAGFWQLRRPL